MQEMTGFEWPGMLFWEDMLIFVESFCKIRRKDHEKEKITRLQKNFFVRFDLLKDYWRHR
jgi:hypothetical protein